MSRERAVPGCKEARAALIDVALGQGEAEAAEAARAHLDRCDACRAEVGALRATIALLQRSAAVAPSAGFRARVHGALAGADARATRRRGRAGGRPLEGLRFRLLLLGHQLRTSRKWQIRVAAALIPLAVGTALLVLESLAERSDERGRAGAPPPLAESPDAPAPPLQSPALVEWTPAFDEPAPDREIPAAQPLEELDETAKRRAADELVKINQLEERSLEKLRAARQGRTPVAGSAGPVSEPEPAAAPDRPRSAVELALQWLVRNQKEDGSWTPGEGEAGLDTAMTALGLLALGADGHHGATAVEPASELDAAAARAAGHLWGKRLRDGTFAGGRDEAAATFCHAVACLALVERHVHLRARGALAGAEAESEVGRLEQALDHLAIELDQLFHSERRRERCAGQNSAWAALALATARHGGVDLGVRPAVDRLVADVLERLRHEQPELMLATSQTIQAMAEREGAPRTAEANERAWSQAVQDVLAAPERVEPSLRFLVASALYGASALAPSALAERRQQWAAFSSELRGQLLELQSPDHGYFDSGRLWTCFGGGAVYETALAVLALRVEERHREWVSARELLER